MDNQARLSREISQIARLQRLLEEDTVLPLRIKFERRTLDSRESRITLSGIRGLVGVPARPGDATRNEFVIHLQVPPEYPWHRIPNIQFIGNIPFHPHVWANGTICWGTAGNPQPDLMLVDWLARIVEYLQFNQTSLIGVNPNSPANGNALSWWQGHRNRLADFVPPIDLARLRFWMEQAKQSGG